MIKLFVIFYCSSLKWSLYKTMIAVNKVVQFFNFKLF